MNGDTRVEEDLYNTFFKVNTYIDKCMYARNIQRNL